MSAPLRAILSDCERYRYALWRDTGTLGGEGTVLFVMLNPSTADAETDGPTIRRCVHFARDWGHARLAVANLYALRSTDPALLGEADDPVGPENDRWLQDLAGGCEERIAAWGASRFVTAEREAHVLEVLTYGGSWGINCLEQTRDLRPRHPLYVPAAMKPKPLRRRAIARA